MIHLYVDYSLEKFKAIQTYNHACLTRPCTELLTVTQLIKLLQLAQRTSTYFAVINHHNCRFFSVLFPVVKSNAAFYATSFDSK